MKSYRSHIVSILRHHKGKKKKNDKQSAVTSVQVTNDGNYDSSKTWITLNALFATAFEKSKNLKVQ